MYSSISPVKNWTMVEITGKNLQTGDDHHDPGRGRNLQTGFQEIFE
jgi:hypothetical protein